MASIGIDIGSKTIKVVVLDGEGAVVHSVYRLSLIHISEERFAAAWGGCEALAPGDGARTAVRRAFGLASLIDNEYH